MNSLVAFCKSNPDIDFNNVLRFESLGGYHLELGSKMPIKTVEDSMGYEKYRTKEKPIIELTKKQKQLHLPIEGEELWASTDSEKSKEFARNLSKSLETNRCVAVYGDAGHGKSFVAKQVVELHPDWRTVVINPYHHLLESVWKSDKWTSMTDYKALGLMVNDNADVERKNKTMNFGETDLLVIDEVFLIGLDNLHNLFVHIKRNPRMKVLVLGDPNQNEAVNPLGGGEKLIKPYHTFLEEAVTAICPSFVFMEYNKRNPKEQKTLDELKRMLFVLEKTPMEVFQHMVAKGVLGGVVLDWKGFTSNGIDTHIAYKNEYSVKLNKHIHTSVFKQKDEFVECDGSFFAKRSVLGYKVGDVVHPTIIENAIVTERGTIAFDEAQRLWMESGTSDPRQPTIEQLRDFLFHERGVYLLRCRLQKLLINTYVRLKSLPKKGKYVFINHDGDEVEVSKSLVTRENFRYNYCRTGHSTQGDTYRKRFCVHLYSSERLCSKRWFWTAITRSVSLKNVFVHVINGASAQGQDPTGDKFRVFAKRKLLAYGTTTL